MAGVDPCLATVLVSDDPGAKAFVDRKHDLCAEVGIDTRRVDLPPGAPAERVYRAVEELGADPAVTALFVQVPLPIRVDEATVRTRVPPEKDVDCFAHANVGRLVAGEPRVRPVTSLAVDRLLSAYGVEVAGRDTVVGDVGALSVGEKAAVTPAPGGVGPLTMACLLHNVAVATAHSVR